MTDAATAGPLRELYAKRPQVIKPGLARMQAALAALPDGAALKTRPSVLIGGTNGKGTTTGFLWQLLAGLGVRAGIFTSPHLLRFNERIQTSQQAISDEMLVSELAVLRADLPEAVYADLSFFEVSTLLGMRIFQRTACEVDLLEVGLGGRWDSTNVASPVVSVITSIGMDHMDLLGDTPAAIAAEKAGIMRVNTPVLWGGASAGTPEAAQRLAAAATELSARLWERGREITASPLDISVALPDLPSYRVPWPLAAAAWPGFLRENFQLSLAALVILLHEPALAPVWRRLLVTSPADALAAAVHALDGEACPRPPSMRARFERVTAVSATGVPVPLLLDVCHNADGAAALVRGLRETGAVAAGRRCKAYVSILKDKDHTAVLRCLREVLEPVLFGVESERGWSPADLAAEHAGLPFHASFAEAWRASPPVAAGLNVVCGSVHALGEVCASLGLAGL